MYFRSQRKCAMDVSLSDYIETGKDGNCLSLMDVVCTDDDMFDNLDTRETYLRLHGYLESALSQRERNILSLRYGLNGRNPLTQREVAELCNISRSYVSRLESKALSKLREEFEKGNQ